MRNTAETFKKGDYFAELPLEEDSGRILSFALVNKILRIFVDDYHDLVLEKLEDAEQVSLRLTYFTGFERLLDEEISIREGVHFSSLQKVYLFHELSRRMHDYLGIKVLEWYRHKIFREDGSLWCLIPSLAVPQNISPGLTTDFVDDFMAKLLLQREILFTRSEAMRLNIYCWGPEKDILTFLSQEYGKEFVEGLDLRDLRDCIVKRLSFVLAAA